MRLVSGLIKSLAAEKKILINNIQLNVEQRKIILNGIDIICSLVKKETEEIG